jgi:hypothetical protein
MWRYIPEDMTSPNHRCENFKSYMFRSFLILFSRHLDFRFGSQTKIFYALFLSLMCATCPVHIILFGFNPETKIYKIVISCHYWKMLT